ncbi:uncharacterized protein NECHADRAFT_82905 [Fusarium vanettenii 77-13-4]|uniref:ribonuclease H n=1 Tax=Fusarium vanettenii (strain ATCC MYA-4622 / CBS 123669 / FGSC 9596 / NRRL 45880 / 77-13-4) TaxID=660122 RepID=C7YX62_FUSV7|nr:uncharacterized protein NECHADRAFT_82905 [Fusarium vanettenii 77-13-4]EEU43775.1 hypothetical protein NECHADRAFT_82905 [Fusarium vanettenii 77-13-4]
MDFDDDNDPVWDRFFATEKLLELNTIGAVAGALERFEDILLKSRKDDCRVQDIIPHILLRLGREQECYDFLKCRPFRTSQQALSLSQLVALTLLKVRLYLDIGEYSDDHNFTDADEPHPVRQRPVGRLVRAKRQYSRLSRMVNDANPYLWEALVKEDNPSLPIFHPPRSKEEADLVLCRCLHAWQETTGAIALINGERSKFTRVVGGVHGVYRVITADGRDSLQSGEKTEGLPKRRSTGSAFPKRFNPPKPRSEPLELFPPTPTVSGHVRFIHRNDGNRVLAYTDGACINNGQLEPRAGWAVVFGKPGSDQEGSQNVVSSRLENEGPFGDDSVATSNRAELRAAIAALRVCDWHDEGFKNIVIATDSSYVVQGATSWAKNWVRKGWTTRVGGNVKNKDLWDLLLGEVERLKQQGLSVDLWNIPRENNTEADAAAKQAAQNEIDIAHFADITAGSPQIDIVSKETIDSDLLPRMLVFCLEYEDLFDSCFGSLVAEIKPKAKMERASTLEAALAILGGKSPPDIILVADGGITRQKEVRRVVIDHLREGARVVLAGCFSSMVGGDEFNYFFSEAGLRWQRGSYHRATVTFRSAYLDNKLMNHLTPSYIQKALFVSNIRKEHVWYAEPGVPNEAAVAWACVGLGRLGYIGDVNGEEASNKVVLGLCGGLL